MDIIVDEIDVIPEIVPEPMWDGYNYQDANVAEYWKYNKTAENVSAEVWSTFSEITALQLADYHAVGAIRYLLDPVSAHIKVGNSLSQKKNIIWSLYCYTAHQGNLVAEGVAPAGGGAPLPAEQDN